MAFLVVMGLTGCVNPRSSMLAQTGRVPSVASYLGGVNALFSTPIGDGRSGFTRINPLDGSKIQFGDKAGDAVFQFENDNYLIWSYLCLSKCSNASKSFGIYVYDWSKKQNELVEPIDALRIYATVSKLKLIYLVLNDFGKYAEKADLKIYDIETRQSMVVTKDLFFFKQSSIYPRYAFDGNVLAWIDIRPQGYFASPSKNTLVYFDLSTNQKHSVSLSASQNPQDIKVYGSAIIWRDSIEQKWNELDIAGNNLFDLLLPEGESVTFKLESQADVIR